MVPRIWQSSPSSRLPTSVYSPRRRGCTNSRTARSSNAGCSAPPRYPGKQLQPLGGRLAAPDPKPFAGVEGVPTTIVDDGTMRA
ncbi:hypothetical protein MHPYR_40225 [uncultured Mycobacterium sp.]|uniref:Uncharacterized protein n=1 Tax=uncultured Mycobacterium sp. TaxID=171292 RepID=A0A1Y5PF14_9MYCO|nr:hypothetical protein MHPYR_40225 [uncultured Mycobacterium sp.]